MPDAMTVTRSGPLSTVQDLGRHGVAHLGVPRAGALDQPALQAGNRLVGNEPDTTTNAA
ncbi:allophanate hydrolase subunit 2 family protein, partial [Kitasatospora sp. NPDC058115]